MNKVITIGREFGSGGKYIGEEIAKRLNYQFYDKELLQRVAKEKNIDVKLLEKVDEKQKDSFWYTFAMASYPLIDSVNSLTDLPNSVQYFIEQTQVIEEIAKKEDCVIIGRCSNIILKDKPNVLNIFIYSSDMNFKVQRKKKYSNLDEKMIQKMIKKTDKERAAYYNYYTNEKWGDRRGYDLMIDTSKLGVEKAIDLIVKYIQNLDV